MENKVDKTIYVYQFSLADGTYLIHESEGLYSTKDSSSETPADRVLINSATLIKIITPAVEQPVVEPVIEVVEEESVEEELV